MNVNIWEIVLGLIGTMISGAGLTILVTRPKALHERSMECAREARTVAETAMAKAGQACERVAQVEVNIVRAQADLAREIDQLVAARLRDFKGELLEQVRQLVEATVLRALREQE